MVSQPVQGPIPPGSASTKGNEKDATKEKFTMYIARTLRRQDDKVGTRPPDDHQAARAPAQSTVPHEVRLRRAATTHLAEEQTSIASHFNSQTKFYLTIHRVF